MEQRELAVRGVGTHEPETLESFDGACRFANFTARSAKAREPIGADACCGLGGLEECAGERAPQLIDEGRVPASPC